MKKNKTGFIEACDLLFAAWHARELRAGCNSLCLAGTLLRHHAGLPLEANLERPDKLRWQPNTGLEWRWYSAVTSLRGGSKKAELPEELKGYLSLEELSEVEAAFEDNFEAATNNHDHGDLIMEQLCFPQRLSVRLLATVPLLGAAHKVEEAVLAEQLARFAPERAPSGLPLSALPDKYQPYHPDYEEEF